jgi:hypothetical protein
MYNYEINSNELNKSIKLSVFDNLEDTDNNDLLERVLEYCIRKQNISNLWMVIGATNRTASDNERLGKEYDLAIDCESNYPESHDQLITLANEDNNIYDKLNHILNGKFSQIIFDWSVTKFFKNKDLIKVLPVLGELLQKDGKIYIDEFSSCPYGGCIGMLWTEKQANNKYILQTQVYDLNVQHYTMEKRKILKNEKDIFVGKRVQFCIRDMNLGQTYRNVDMYKLFDNMDENGSFNEEMFKNIYSYRNESLKMLTELFPIKFKIELHEDNNYPNNSDRINVYWVITKI